MNNMRRKVNTNWGSKRPLEEWHGLILDNNDFVLTINLYKNNLQGTIPESFSTFSLCRDIFLQFNSLEGTFSFILDVFNLNEARLQELFPIFLGI